MHAAHVTVISNLILDKVLKRLGSLQGCARDGHRIENSCQHFRVQKCLNPLTCHLGSHKMMMACCSGNGLMCYSTAPWPAWCVLNPCLHPLSHVKVGNPFRFLMKLIWQTTFLVQYFYKLSTRQVNNG